MSMTWGEFKAEAESKGVTDDMEIWYIDISLPTANSLFIDPDKEYGVRIG